MREKRTDCEGKKQSGYLTYSLIVLIRMHISNTLLCIYIYFYVMYLYIFLYYVLKNISILCIINTLLCMNKYFYVMY